MHDLTCLNHFSFHEVRYEGNHESNFPMPARYNFIMFLQKGKALITSKKKTITLSEGELLYIPRGITYSVKLFGDPSILFGSYAYLHSYTNEDKRYTIQKIAPSQTAFHYIKNVSAINGINDESLGYFYLFLHEIYQTLLPCAKDERQTTLSRAMNFIMQKPDCTMREVASYCHVSESGLYAIFNKESQITPARFKLRIKLERAVDYLISTDFSIEEISLLCGFSSSSYFRKKIYSAYQKTPSQIRKFGVGKTLGF